MITVLCVLSKIDNFVHSPSENSKTTLSKRVFFIFPEKLKCYVTMKKREIIYVETTFKGKKKKIVLLLLRSSI